MVFTCLLRLVKFIVVVVALIYLAIYLCPVGPCSRRFHTNLSKPCPEFLGPLTRNNILDSTERLFMNEIGIGPAALAIQNGFLYTGVSDGRIFKFKDNKFEFVAKTGPPGCVPAHLASSKDLKCGYPLGMRFDRSGDLIVADCVKGLLKVNTKTGRNVTLAPNSMKVAGTNINFLGDLDIAKEGDIYFSDMSSSWSFDYPNWLNLLVPEPNGRILHYNVATKQVTVVLDHLYLPTGIQLSAEEDFLLFSQGFAQNIMKYNLKGVNKGQVELLIDNLPGVVSHIRPSGRGTYWVAVSLPRLPWKPSLWEKLDFCTITKFIVYSTLEATSQLFGLLKTFTPLPMIETFHRTVQLLLTESIYQPSYGLIVEFTAKGEVLRSLHSPEGVVRGISHVTENAGILYLGSPMNSFVGKLKLK